MLTAVPYPLEMAALNVLPQVADVLRSTHLSADHTPPAGLAVAKRGLHEVLNSLAWTHESSEHATPCCQTLQGLSSN